MNQHLHHEAFRGADVPPLPRWAVGFPGLIWQIELPASRLSVIKNWYHPELGTDTTLLLKNRAFRKSVVMRDDRAALEIFWDIMFSRESAAVRFRLKSQPERPLVLQGWAHPQDSQIYCGILQYDHTCEPPDELAQVPGGMHIQRSRYPIIIINMEKNVVLRYNNAAGRMFSSNDNPLMHLHDIAPNGMHEKFIEAAEYALENDVWSGALSFGGGSMSFTCRVRISNCSDDNNRMVRLSFLEMPRSIQPDYAGQQTGGSSAILQAVQESPTLRDALGTLINTADFPAMDGLMFSDILSHEGRVQVYGVGKPYEEMPWGATHEYEGTIAQDIERFNLRSLIMDDTRDSIKSIDWVLFIPHGVRSYFAKPFFDDNKLRAVMIMTSSAPRAFPPDSEDYFSHLYQPFALAIDNWRKNKK